MMNNQKIQKNMYMKTECVSAGFALGSDYSTSYYAQLLFL
jgi:hypothetical protein